MSKKYEWPVLPLSAEILHLDDDMLKAVLVEIRANVRAAVQAAQPEAVGEQRPRKDQRIVLNWQGRVDGTVEAFEINGMMCIGDPEGVTYITREQAAEFFGFAAAPTPEPMSAPTAEPVGLTDSDLERMFERAGGKWNGDMWTIEDADFHPAMRSLISKSKATPPSAATPEPSDAERLDAARWRAFIGLDYALRAEWATNLSLAPILTKWVDNSIAAMTETKGGK